MNRAFRREISFRDKFYRHGNRNFCTLRHLLCAPLALSLLQIGPRDGERDVKVRLEFVSSKTDCPQIRNFCIIKDELRNSER
jgi:hypothetical protein